MAVAAAFPGAELERADPPGGDVPSVRLGIHGEPPEAGGPGMPSNLGAILVELLARLPDGASATWHLRVTPLAPTKDQRSDGVPGTREMLLDSFLNRPSRPVPASARSAPHGDAVARLLDAVPKDQAHRVHLLELAEKDHPRGFNPIELDGADPELVAAQFVDTMSDLYFAGLASPPHRQLQYLRSALMTLLLRATPGGVPWTLESLNRLLIDPVFREAITNGLEKQILLALRHQ